MAISEPYELDGVTVGASELSVVSGTTALQSIDAAGDYELWVDAGNMAKGDEFVIKAKGKVEGTGGAQKVFGQWSIQGVQSEIFITPRKLILYGMDFTITKLAGTDRAFDASIRKISHAGLEPTTAGRTLDVTATGAAGIDWGNVENPSTANNLSATTINLVNTLTTYTGNTPQTGDSFLRLTGTGAVTFASLTVSAATNFTGNVAMAAGLTITQSTLNGSAIALTGNGSGSGLLSTGGSTGRGISAVGVGGGQGLYAKGGGAGAGALFDGGTTGAGFETTGGSTSGHGWHAGGAAGQAGVHVAGSFTIDEVFSAGTNSLPWNSAYDTEVQSECEDALVAKKVDLIAGADAAYASLTAGSLFAELLENNAGVVRYTAAALVNGPGASSSTYLATGTVASTTGTTTTLDAGAVNTADYYLNARLVITAGTGAGQERLITAYASGRIATHAAWTTNPTAASTYQVRDARTTANVISANGIAIGSPADLTLIVRPRVVDGFLQLLTNTTYSSANENLIEFDGANIPYDVDATDAVLTIKYMHNGRYVCNRLASTVFTPAAFYAAFALTTTNYAAPDGSTAIVVNENYRFQLDLKYGSVYTPILRGPCSIVAGIP